MAKVIINRATLQRLSQSSVSDDLEKRARKVLLRLQNTAPRDTGDLARSLRIEQVTIAGRLQTRIVSDDPNIKAILEGTKGPYSNIPPWGRNSALGRWGVRHGFNTPQALFLLGRHVQIHGTSPAGTHEGNRDWIKEALRELR